MPKRKQVPPDDGLCITCESRQYINRIVSTLCEMYKITPEEIVGRSQQRHIAEPRQMAMLLIRHADLRITYDVISKIFNRTHGTVLISCRAALDLLELDDTVRQRIQPILSQLNIQLPHARNNRTSD